jgi:mRNA interferase RelE/StbE
MPTLETIEEEIKSLPRDVARELQEWLAEYLDDREELNPGFVSSIERGKEDILHGRVRVLLMRQATEIYAKEFDRVFLALPPSVRLRIEEKIQHAGSCLESYPHLRLQGRDEFKLRVGDYRIIYGFDVARNELFLFAMGHRREVYR